MATKQDVHFDAVVAGDGSGNYNSINAAIAAAPLKSAKRHVIHIKAGVYKELVKISEDTWNVTLIGDGMDVTVISGKRCCADNNCNTEDTAIVSVRGEGFIARDLTIENTAGPRDQLGQAVALMSLSDNSVVYRCALKGYQDTLYARSNKQLYRECRISGTVDFIFGDAAAVFQKCTILPRLPINGQQNTITAQGRRDDNHRTGFSFQFCVVVADDDLARAKQQGSNVETYLGRPWKSYSRVVFMESSISDIVDAKGWLPWEGQVPPDTLYYGEYKNDGPGAVVNGRVDWHGFHVIRDASEASTFTVDSFIQGNRWLPSTGVEFTPGL